MERNEAYAKTGEELIQTCVAHAPSDQAYDTLYIGSEVDEKALVTMLMLTRDIAKRVEIDEGHPQYCSIDGIVYTKDKKLLFMCPRHHEGDVLIPEGTQEIFSCAFQDVSIGTLFMPSSIRGIDPKCKGAAFAGSHIDCLRFADDVEAIPPRAFAAANIKSVIFPGKLKKIAESAFVGSNLNVPALRFPESLETIADNAFSDCNCDELMLPKSIKCIGQNAFGKWARTVNLEGNTLPEGFTDAFINTMAGPCCYYFEEEREKFEWPMVIRTGGKSVAMPSHMATKGLDALKAKVDSGIATIDDLEYSFQYANNPELKQDTALAVWELDNGNEKAARYIHRMANKMADRYVKLCKHDRLETLLASGIMPREAVEHYLPEVMSATKRAYILEALQSQKECKIAKRI